MAGAESMAEAALSALSAQGLRRVLEPIDGPQGAVVNIGAEPLINLSSNDYLGLASSTTLISAAVDGAQVGAGTGSSRLVTGSLPIHATLEAALAAFEGTGAAVLFNSGYCANLGAVQSLVGPGDAVFSDALNHASLIDGAKISRAAVHVYPHLDTEALDTRLAASPAQRKLIVTDAVFSMDGDCAPLPALCELADRHGAMLLVDEAHATGVFGERGRGLCEHLGCEAQVDVRIGTLSKAAGSFGAFAAASRAVCELFVNRARAFVFTTALPPSVCAASMASLALMREPARREALWRNIRQVADGLHALGLPAEPRSPIFPVVLGTPERALAAARALRARGVLAKAIRPPTVPEHTSRLRLSVSAAHSPAQLDRALTALREALAER